MRRVPIYREGQGTPIYYVNADNESQLQQDYMWSDFVTISFTSAEPVTLQIGDFILLEDFFTRKTGKYILYNLPTVNRAIPKQNEYTTTFKNPLYRLQDIVLFLNSKSQFEFSFTGKPEGFLDIVCKAMNEEEGTGVWNIGNIEALVVDLYRIISFENVTCSEAVKEIADTFGIDFYFTTVEDKHYIHLHQQEDRLPVNTVFEANRYLGLMELGTRRADEATIKTRVWGAGSSENLGTEYTSDFTPPRLSFKGINGRSYVEREVSKYGMREEVKIFDTIKPERISKFTNVGDLTNPLDIILTDGTLDFDINEHIVEGIEATVTMLTGACAGRDLPIVEYDHSTRQITVLAVTDETTGLVYPSPDTPILTTDEYNFLNITLPEDYIASAEQELEYQTDIYTYNQLTPELQYTSTLDRSFIARNDINLYGGLLIDIFSEELNFYTEFRITKLVQKLSDENSYEIDFTPFKPLNYLSNLNALQFTIKVNAGETFTLPATSDNNSFTLDWGDGTVEPVSTASPSHTYEAGGYFTLTLDGIVPEFSFANATQADKDKLNVFLQIGETQLQQSCKNMFKNCSNMVFCNADGISSIDGSFEGFIAYCGALRRLDITSPMTVSSVVSFASNCKELITITGIDSWADTSGVTSLVNTFLNCQKLATGQQHLNTWFTQAGLTNIISAFAYNYKLPATFDPSGWNVELLEAAADFMTIGSELTQAIYTKLLDTTTGWVSRGMGTPSGDNRLSFGNSMYDTDNINATIGRGIIIDLGWDIWDAGDFSVDFNEDFSVDTDGTDMSNDMNDDFSVYEI